MNKRAWQEGYDAYGRGCPLINNPYVRLTDEFEAWDSGWTTAKWGAGKIERDEY